MASIYDKCKICKHSKFDKSCGIICGLTMAKPTFKENCPNIVADEAIIQKKKEKAIEEKKSHRKELILTLVGLLLCALIVGGVRFYRQAERAEQRMKQNEQRQKQMERTRQNLQRQKYRQRQQTHTPTTKSKQ